MKQIHLHKEAGIRIHDEASDETVYLDTLKQAAEDAEMTLNWPDPDIVRIFPLVDGRIAVVRATPTGLRQEAASPEIQAWSQQVATKTDVLIQQARREAEVTDTGSGEEG